MTQGLPTQTTGEVKGRNVAGAHLQPTYRSPLLKKSGDAGRGGSGVRERIDPVNISQGRKVDISTKAKTMTGIGVVTQDGAVLRVRRRGNGQRARAWNKLLHVPRKNLTMTNGSKDLAPESSWDLLLFR